jgi:signal transduction histidine kinase
MCHAIQDTPDPICPTVRTNMAVYDVAPERADVLLSRIETVTDAALAHLELDDLLQELLNRIHRLLSVDTTAILLLSDDKCDLLVRAACGLEEEVVAGVRIPVGTGIAGRIAAGDTLVLVDEPAAIAAVSPILRAKGVQALAGVPLLVEGRVIGVLHVGTLHSRHWTVEDTQLLQRVADRVALAIDRAQAYAAEQQARIRAEAAEQRLAFLADASAVLATSLDEQTTLQHIVQLTVPHLAEWCLALLMDGTDALPRATGRHTDSGQQVPLETWIAKIAVDPPASSELSRLLSIEQSSVVVEINGDESKAHHPADTLRGLLQEMGTSSALLVPLRARGHTGGMVILGWTGIADRISSETQALAEDLARRAALAVDNARLYQQAQDALRLRDEFLAIAAHELKTPLTVLLGLAESWQRRLAREETASTRDQRTAQQITTQAQRIHRLIDQVLDISRLQGGGLILEPQVVDLVALARRIVADFQPTLEQHLLTLDCEEEALLVVGDEIRLEQVLYNLLQNAIKYSPNGGDVGVGVQRHGDQVCLVVSDQGIGIPETAIPHLFKQFYRVAGSAQHQRGSGIGLYIVQEIVRRHGGTVDVRSHEGERSTFTVCLPAATLPRPCHQP